MARRPALIRPIGVVHPRPNAVNYDERQAFKEFARAWAAGELKECPYCTWPLPSNGDPT